ncbi:unnamed protein product, partial [Cuscuta epithymum]
MITQIQGGKTSKLIELSLFLRASSSKPIWSNPSSTRSPAKMKRTSEYGCPPSGSQFNPFSGGQRVLRNSGSLRPSVTNENRLTFQLEKPSCEEIAEEERRKKKKKEKVGGPQEK